MFAGGAPIHVTRAWWKSLRPKPSRHRRAGTLDQAGGLNSGRVHQPPADGTLLKVGADVRRVERGVPIPDFGVGGADRPGGDRQCGRCRPLVTPGRRTGVTV